MVAATTETAVVNGNGVANGKGKAVKSKNQLRRLKAKQKKAAVGSETPGVRSPVSFHQTRSNLSID